MLHNIINKDGTAIETKKQKGTPTVGSVAYAAGTTELIAAANANRKRIVLYNYTGAVCRIRFTSSGLDVYPLLANQFIEIDYYAGDLYVNFGSGGLNALVYAEFE